MIRKTNGPPLGDFLRMRQRSGLGAKRDFFQRVRARFFASLRMTARRRPPASPALLQNAGLSVRRARDPSPSRRRPLSALRKGKVQSLRGRLPISSFRVPATCPLSPVTYSLILYSSIFLYRVRRLMPRMEALRTLLPPVTLRTWVR